MPPPNTFRGNFRPRGHSVAYSWTPNPTSGQCCPQPPCTECPLAHGLARQPSRSQLRRQGQGISVLPLSRSEPCVHIHPYCISAASCHRILVKCPCVGNRANGEAPYLRWLQISHLQTADLPPLCVFIPTSVYHVPLLRTESSSFVGTGT